MKLYLRRLLVTFVLVAILAMPFSASSAVTYYVSLGDSLAFGFQPNGTFNQGYADQLFAKLRGNKRELQLVKLGCPRETTDTMIYGGVCPYPQGSQLNEAAAFLKQNPVALITIDIGANDILDCSFTKPLDMRCFTDVLADIERNLRTILAKLGESEENGGDVPIIGMTYYDPLLAYWVQGGSGHAAAADSRRAFLTFNDTLERIYKAYGSRVADVDGAFSSTDFATKVSSPKYGKIPLNVSRICEWTWMCELSDIHPNTAGYGEIARAFFSVAPSLSP